MALGRGRRLDLPATLDPLWVLTTTRWEARDARRMLRRNNTANKRPASWHAHATHTVATMPPADHKGTAASAAKNRDTWLLAFNDTNSADWAFGTIVHPAASAATICISLM